MSDLSVSKIMNYLFGTRIERGEQGCSGSKKVENITLRETDSGFIWQQNDMSICKANSPYYAVVAAAIFNQPAFKDSFDALTPFRQQQAIANLASKIEAKTAAHKKNLCQNPDPASQGISLQITSDEVAQARGAALQGPENQPETAKKVQLVPTLSLSLKEKEQVKFPPVVVEQSFKLPAVELLYVNEKVEVNPTLPNKCKYTVNAQELAADVSALPLAQEEASTLPVDPAAEPKVIKPVPVRILSQQSLTIAKEGEYEVTLTCENHNAINIGKIKVNPKRAGRPIRSPQGPKLPACEDGPLGDAMRDAGECK